MFNKFEFFGAIVVALTAGMAYGYTKAREKCMEAVAKALIERDLKQEEKESE